MKKLDVLLKKFRRINASYFKTKEGNLYMFYHCHECGTYHTYWFEKKEGQHNQIIQDKMFYVEKTFCKNQIEGEPFLVKATQPVIHSENMVTYIAKKTVNFTPKESAFIHKSFTGKYLPKAVVLDSVRKTIEEQELKEDVDKTLLELLKLAEEIGKKIESSINLKAHTDKLVATAGLIGKIQVCLELNDSDISFNPEIINFLMEEAKEIRKGLQSIARDLSIKQNTTLSRSLEEKVQKMFSNLASDY